MTETWVTRCPKCTTAFQVNRKQLVAAKGLVRCGSCLNVFQSQNYFVGSKPPDFLAQAGASVESVEDKTPQSQQHDEATVAASSTPEDKTDFNKSILQQQDEEAALEHARNVMKADESWGESVLAELEQKPTEAEEIAPPAPAPLPQLQDEPLTVSEGNKHRYRWWTLSLVAAFLLLVQLAWLNAPTLSRQPSLYPWYAAACNILNCTLPPLSDTDKIQTGNLVVKANPDISDALSVDAVIYSQTPYSQPFPVIELSFSDRHGAMVASRRFKPDEYLGGEMTGKTMMPANTPIHFSLDIVDPGAEAIGYEMRFYPLVPSS